MRAILILTLVAAIGSASCNLFSGRHHAASEFRDSFIGSQAPLSVNLADFKPQKDLYTLSEISFTVLKHPAFPRHAVRIKKTSFCDNTVDGYTGYIDIEARHLFFYFFESRDQPDKDDVLMWTNGGGPWWFIDCRLIHGTWYGPCRITNSSGPYFHPESWNSKANIFFIDQPVGVGFSYADHGEFVGTTEEAAKDVAAFVAVFFEHFSKFKGRPFHLSGESYGGRYLPLFASEIYDQNSKLEAAGLSPINLTSVMIGQFRFIVSVYDMLCTSASLFPIVNIASCVRMKQVMPRCKKWMQEACFEQFEAINCQAAVGFCSAELQGPFTDSIGLNPYDIREKCTYTEDSLCYPLLKLGFLSRVTAYLNRDKVKKMIGVDSAAGNFSLVAMPVYWAFESRLDKFHPTALHVAALLERGIQVLIYVGNFDLVCNWVGNQMWTLALEWSGKEDFNAKPLREWTVDGKRAGLTRSAKGLTFATIDNAGHMAPYNKPKESLELVKRWLYAEVFAPVQLSGARILISVCFFSVSYTSHPPRKIPEDPPGQLLLPTASEAKAAGLDLDNIQGDILIGMKKNKEIIFFHIEDVSAFKTHLDADIHPLIASTTQLLNTSTQPTTVVNVAFSRSGPNALGVSDEMNADFFTRGQAAGDAEFIDGGNLSIRSPLYHYPGGLTDSWVPAFVVTSVHDSMES
ncbi:Alpha/Beta hydrolase protein [Mycena floridula]|nr:Alpha/Beta hydrolase protein [Mycena floridula]